MKTIPIIYPGIIYITSNIDVSKLTTHYRIIRIWRVNTKMTQSDYWETINYHNLPQWMKRVSKPKQWVNKTYTKIFYGKPYDYQVEYKVIRGKLDISYWRSGHKVNTADLEAQIVTKKKELKSLEIGPKLLFLVGLIGLLFYGLGIILIIIWFYYRGRWEAQKTNLQNDIANLQNEIDYENREWIDKQSELWALDDNGWIEHRA